MRKLGLLAAVASAAIALATSAGAVTVTKAPDVGAYWNPLSGNGGTYIYANSFVAPVSGTVTEIGLWLRDRDGGEIANQPITFSIYDTAGGGGPDSSNVIATTGQLTFNITSSLSLFTASTLSSLNLIGGQTYWVAGDVRGVQGGGAMQVGGHTRNSGGIVDNGTFWYSNDPAGASFDGQNNTTEMAFTVSMNEGNAVPEPATWALMIGGFGMAGATLRRRKALAA